MQLLNIDGPNKFEVIKVNPYFSYLNEDILSEVIAGMRCTALSEMRSFSGKEKNMLGCI